MNRKWVGTIYDLESKEANLELDLPQEVTKVEKSGTFEGNFRVMFGKKLKKPEIEGPLSVHVEGNAIRFNYESQTSMGNLAFEFNGEVINAEPFAKFSLFGSYRTKGGRGSSFFKGGSIIAWLFAGADKEK